MHNRRAGAKGLVFGGLMASLVAIFALVPGLGSFMPIPLVLAYVRYGGRAAVLTGIVATLLSLMFLNPIQTFLFTVPAGVLPGLAFGYGFRNKLKPMTIGLIAVAVFVLSYAGTYVLTRAALTNGRDPIATAVESKEFKQIMDPIWNALEQSGKNPTGTDAQKKAAQQQLEVFQEFRNHPVSMFWVLLPSTLFMMGAFMSWLNYMLCRWILPRFGHDIPAPTPLAEFRLPVWLSGVFLVLMFAQMYVGNASLLNAPWYAKALANVFQPLTWIFVLYGVAVTLGWLRKREISKGMALGGILLGFFIFGPGMGIQIFVMLGIWDTIFDFRGQGHGWWKRPPEPTE